VKEEYQTRWAKHDGAGKNITANTEVVEKPVEEESATPTRWTRASTILRAEPRVLHGYTLTKEISFREVCVAIKETAFVTRFVYIVSPFKLTFFFLFIELMSYGHQRPACYRLT